MNFDTRVAKVRNEIPITKTEISEIVNLLEETRQKWRSKVIEEASDTNLDIKKLQERIITFSDAVNRTEIQTPVNGVVNKLHINTIGGVIQSGQVLAEIIPVEEVLVVEGRISIEDRGKVWIGQKAAAKITAYDYSIFGSIDGELTHISADSFADNQGMEYYQVRITLSQEGLSKEQLIFPGMSVDINIMANKVSVLHALLKPFIRIRENALREV
jgi:HlyD family type I secretion membrane fusion protein